MATRPEPYLAFVEDERVWALLDRLCGEGDPATLAFAWLFAQPHVTAVIVGPRRPEHLSPAITALQQERVDLQKDTFAF